jgi:hypothetical protein
LLNLVSIHVKQNSKGATPFLVEIIVVSVVILVVIVIIIIDFDIVVIVAVIIFTILFHGFINFRVFI